MSDAESANLEEFIQTGRVGRRNALPDILDKSHAGVGTAGLSETLEKLKCSGEMLIWLPLLTHWGLNKRSAISQTFSD